MRMTLGQIAAALQSPLPPVLATLPGMMVPSVSTDTRTLTSGALFVCLKGEHFDGHAYLAEAASKGAVAAVVEMDMGDAPLPCITVPSTLSALAQMALAYRRSFPNPVIGITGTAGKTTVKEILAHLLEGIGPVARNKKNLNNQIGLPSTMLAASGEEKYWVMETGINFVGDMDPLANMLQPDMTIAINAGAGHLEGLHDVPTVAKEKSKLISAMVPVGKALVNIDGPELRDAARATGRDIVWFSTQGNTNATYHAVYRSYTPTGGRFGLTMAGEPLEVHTPFAAPFLAESLIAAAAAAHMYGVPTAIIQERLATASLPGQRFQPQMLGDWTVIDDSYNANPLSMAAVLGAGKALTGDGRLVLVLGEMRELGRYATQAHFALGHLAATLNPDAVFWAGGNFEEVKAGMEDFGATAPQKIGTPEAFAQEIKSMQGGSGVLLFKGSRANALEHYVAAVKAAFAPPAPQVMQEGNA